MSELDQKHYIICKLKELATELGRVPMRHELTTLLPRVNVDQLFKTYDGLLLAAGMRDLPQTKNKEKQVPFKFQKKMIESFNVTEANLDHLFMINGHPDVLRLVARPDSHIEEKDEKALLVYEKFAQWYKPHIDLIMGDFIGAGGVSHWDAKDLKPKRLVPEVKEARAVLDSFCKATPETKSRVYLKGNHEDWIDQAMIKHMPEMFDGLDDLGLTPDLKKLLDLDAFGYELIELNHILKIGKAHFTHGLYTGNNHPKTHLDRVKASIYYGHLHDVKNTHDMSIDGMIEAASLGCLCRVDGKFMKGKPTNWVQGFGIFEFFPDGTFSRYQVRIFDGKFSFNGKVFAA